MNYFVGCRLLELAVCLGDKSEENVICEDLGHDRRLL